MSTLVSQLIVQLIDKVTAPARAVAASVDRLRDAAAANQRRLDEMRGRMFEAAAGAYALAKALGEPIKAAMDLEEALADVNKIADFAPEALAKFRGEILDLTKVMPMTAKDLLAIAEGAASAGTATEDLVPTTKLIAKAALAWGMSAELAGENIAKIRTALGLTLPEVSDLADVMNYLADSTASTAPDLTDFVRRVGVLGKMAGLNAKQVAAFGASIISSGAAPDVAATGFQAMVRGLTKGEAATKGQREAFEELGLEAATVAKAMQKNAQETIFDVMTRLRGLSADKRLSVANQLFGDEGRPMLALIDQLDATRKALQDATDATKTAGSVQKEFDTRTATTLNKVRMLGNALNRLSIAVGTALLPAVRAVVEAVTPLIDAITALASAHPEALAAIVAIVGGLVALRVATIAARWGFLFLKGGILEAGLGVAKGASGIGSLIGLLFRSRNATRLAAVETAGLAAAQVASTSKAYAMARSLYQLAREGGVAGVNVGQATKAMAEAGAAASAAQQRLAAANAALASAGGIASLASRGGAIAMLLSIGPIATSAAAAVVAAMAAITAPVWGAIAAVAALGVAVYRYWEPISNFVAGFAQGIGEALGPAVDAVLQFHDRLVTAIGSFVTKKLIDFGEWLGFDRGTIEAKMTETIATVEGFGKRVVDIVKAIPAMIGDWVSDIFTMKDYSDEAEAGFRETGRRAGVALVEAVKAAVNDLIAWFSSLPARILKAIGSIDLSGVIKWPSLPSWLGGGSASSAVERADAANNNAAAASNAAAPAVAGARAAGGPVVGGRTYLVGERGRELFTPDTDGFVYDAETTSRMGRGGEGRSMAQSSGNSVDVKIDMGGVTIQRASDIDTICREVDRKLRDAFAGLQVDQNYSAAGG